MTAEYQGQKNGTILYLLKVGCHLFRGATCLGKPRGRGARGYYCTQWPFMALHMLDSLHFSDALQSASEVAWQ